MNGFFTAVKENASFVGVCLVTVLAITLIAYGIEKAAKRKNGDKDRVLATRKIVMIGMFGAISGILYCFDFAIPIAPNFYKLDFSELPALIAGFAFGPVAGVLVEFVKQVVKLMIKSTSTAFVGDLRQTDDQVHLHCFCRRPRQLPDRMHAGTSRICDLPV